MKARFLTSLGLSVLFIVVYTGTNLLTATRADVGTWYYSWEALIPFVPAMIIPYMSIDLFFVVAPFRCRNQEELRSLAARIGFVIAVAGASFLLFPLELTLERPHVEGWLGAIFNPFVSMDAPHNLFPSLHVALSVILVAAYHRWTRGPARLVLHGWFGLIGLSTLLTHQHHVVDVAGGLALGGIALHLFPVRHAAPLAANPRVALRYALGSLAMLLIALWLGGWARLLAWPALSLGITAIAYAGVGGRVFRKESGRLPAVSRLLLAPVLLGQELSRRYYARRDEPWNEIVDGVWLGRQLGAREARAAREAGVTAVVDLTAEFTEADSLLEVPYLSLPVLDLTAPTPAQLEQAVAFIAEHSRTGIVYVHCKVGYSRSVTVVASFLQQTWEPATTAETLERIRAARPGVVVRPEVLRALRSRLAPGCSEPGLVQN